ncbi:hypothetical protein Y032_0041g366 [Ancylostoma ceylanicum]|uniref:Follistatin-like domain-containing protein n=1 Tax=Ancylostoma ceylanicum TaxID=53326 RepID=A0A016UH59_9BILA|nr:hypothetical protein Y032_0041g366 [Ancylostoma ceylanicum]
MKSDVDNLCDPKLSEITMKTTFERILACKLRLNELAEKTFYYQNWKYSTLSKHLLPLLLLQITSPELAESSKIATCNKQCPYGQVCKSTVVQCIRAPCPPIEECVQASMADYALKRIRITDPCATVRCSANTRCVAKGGQAGCVPIANDLPLGLGGSGCKKKCPYGQVCQFTQVQCFVAPCPEMEECVPAPARDAPRKIGLLTNPCAAVLCAANTRCIATRGEAQCVPIDPCETVRCTATTTCSAEGGRARCVPIVPDSLPPSTDATCKKTCPYGQVCRLTQVQCFAAPCPPLEECVPATPRDAPAKIRSPCTLLCPIGQKCVVQQVYCIRAPCPAQQKCVPMTMADGYYNPHTAPTLTCANALCAPETPRCVESPSGPKCVAVKTCSQLKCKKGERCEQPEKFKDAQCVTATAGPSTSYVDEPVLPAPLRACNLFCIQGRRCVVTPSGPKCLPTPTCNELRCPVGQVCREDDPNLAATCVSYQADSPDNGCTPTSCPPNQKCVVQTGTRVVCIPTLTCSTLRCGAGTKCYPGDSNDDAQCVPYSTCTTTSCDSNSRCVEGNGFSDARCVPIAVCATPCLSGMVCRKGRCVTTCDQVKCGSNQKCVQSDSGASCAAARTCSDLTCFAGFKCQGGMAGSDARCVPDLRGFVGRNAASFDTPSDSRSCPLSCGGGTKCVMTPNGPTCMRSRSCDDITCPRKTKCLQNSITQEAVCVPTATCDVLDCRDGYQCIAGGANEDAQCVPFDTCDTILCPPNTRCLDGRGFSNARCIAAPSCDRTCGGGNRCVNGNCVTTCQVVRCGAGQKCIETDTGAQCSQITSCESLNCYVGTRCVEASGGADAYCAPVSTRVGNARISSDTDGASHFLPPDEADRIQVQCRLAKCIKGRVCQDFMRKVTCVADQRNSCKNRCQAGMICVLQKVYCYAPPCYPIAVCIKDPYFHDGPPVPTPSPSYVIGNHQKPKAIPTPSNKPDPMTSYGDEPSAGKQSDAQIKRIATPKICRADEVLNQCGSRCEPTCANADGQLKICPRICDPPACVCASGLYRSNGQCLTKEQCLGAGRYSDARPLPPKRCRSDEVLNQCGNRCEPTCANASGEPRICPAICDPPACTCASGLFRRGGQCVTKEQCLGQYVRRGRRAAEKDSMTGYGDEPEVPLDPCFSFPCPAGQACVQDANGARCEPNKPALHCSANETVSDCGALCEGKCSQLGKGPFACPEICLPPACACSPGKYRNDAGLCVASRDCPLNCGENEQVDQCGSRCEPTCENAYGKVKVCVLICDPPACVCKPNYYRKNGKCVPQRDCPPPRHGKTPQPSYVDEPITPQPTTSSKGSYVDEPVTPPPYNAKTSERSYVDEPITPPPYNPKTSERSYVDEPITPKPNGGKTYVDEPITPKPDTGKNYVDEPGTQCSANETLNGCGNLCEGKCENLGKGPIACPAICAPPACACKEGYYRNAGGVCVTARDCPLVCGDNEEVNNCGNLCEPTCENAFGKPKICIKICAPPACVCKSNFYRKDGKCVPKTECPAPNYGKGSTSSYVDEPVTPPPNGKTTENYVDEPYTKCSVNETLSECGNICEGKCENIGKGPIACPAVCEPPACACKDGYFRNKDGNCVTAIDCSLNCGTNEQVNPCGSRCEPTCENAFGKPKVCVKICDPPACVCKANYYRKDGQCVPQMGCGIPGKPGKTGSVGKPGGGAQAGNGYSKNQGTKPQEKPGTGGTNNMNSYGDEPIVPDGPNSCEDSECEDGMVCVEGETESVCVAKDPGIFRT